MTAQVSERLIYGDKEIPLFTNPLSLYLKNAGVSFVSPHTANWRGYVGTWQILEHDGVERLYLVELAAYKSYEEEIGLADVFQGTTKSLRIGLLGNYAVRKVLSLNTGTWVMAASMNTTYSWTSSKEY